MKKNLMTKRKSNITFLRGFYYPTLTYYLNTGILLQTKFVKTVKIEERDNNFNGNAEI